MSWQPAHDPKPGDRLSCDAIETVIVPRSRDIGSFEVRRALPSAQRQMVGPFIFFDQMGPAEFLLGAGMDVRSISLRNSGGRSLISFRPLLANCEQPCLLHGPEMRALAWLPANVQGH